MQLLKLEFRNVYGASGEVTFGDGKTGGEDNLTFRRLLTALYGAERLKASLAAGAETSLSFVSGANKEYLLVRNFEAEGKTASLYLVDGADRTEIAARDRDAILEKEAGTFAFAFDGDGVYLENAFALAAPDRSRICSMRDELEDAIKNLDIERAANAVAARRLIPDGADSETADVDPFYDEATRIEREASALSAEREEVLAERLRAAEKEQIRREAIGAKEDLDAHTARGGDVEAARKAIANDDLLQTARQYLSLRDEKRAEAERLSATLADYLQKSDALKKKSHGGDDAERECEADFIMKSERANALRKKFTDEMCGANAEASEVRRSLDAFYAANDPQIQDLTQKKKRLDNEYEALLLSITSLETKKSGLVHPMSYKKAVIDGTVLENKIEKLTSVIEDGNRRSGELQLETASKEEDIRDANDAIKAKTLEKAEVVAALLKGSAHSLDEAVNRDQALKNEAYAAFITTENLEKESAAIQEKISNLKLQNRDNADRQRELQAAKTEIEVRLVKLRHKKESLDAELRNASAQNLFSEEAAKLRFGDRCPVCDSYIVKKNPILPKSEAAVGADLKLVNREILDLEKKLERVALKLGAYLSTTASGDAYLTALENTLLKKQALTRRIYRDFGADSKQQFQHAIEEIGNETARFNGRVKKMQDLNAEIAAEETKKKVLETAVRQLSGRETKRIAAAVDAAKTELDAALSEYRKLMPVFGGRPAKELLSGSLIDDIELETVDGDLVSQTKNFREVTVQKIETDRLLLLLKNKLVSDLKDADAESAVDVVLRETARKAKELSAELNLAEQAYEEAKLKLAAVRRVNRNAGKEAADFSEAAGSIRSKISAAERDASAAADAADAVLKQFQISEDELSKTLLKASDRNKLQTAVTEYDAKFERLRFRQEFTAGRPMTLELIDLDALNARLAGLDRAIAELTALAAETGVKRALYQGLLTDRADADRRYRDRVATLKMLDVWRAATEGDDYDPTVLVQSAAEMMRNESLSAAEITHRLCSAAGLSSVFYLNDAEKLCDIAPGQPVAVAFNPKEQ